MAEAQTAPKPVTATVNLLLVNTGGVIRASCSGAYARPNCDLDFSGASLAGRPVKIVFSIAPGSTPGVTFAGAAANALWIVDKALAGPRGEPTAPYSGAQFVGFTLARGGKRLDVVDSNDDGKTYQYALRFNVPTQFGALDAPQGDQAADEYSIALMKPDGTTMVMDPQVKNGGTGN